MNLGGQRIAVAGMGRSGMGIAAAGIKRGAKVTVYDEQNADTVTQMDAVEHLQGLGANVVTGWHGHLKGEPFEVLVASPGFRRSHPAIRDALAEGKQVISEVEFAWIIAKSPILGITGTNGKSTTTVLTWLLVNAALGQGRGLLCGNISGSGYEELTLTEAADRATEDQALVAEISSYQLEWVRDFKPRVATITNITPDHLDRHPDFEDYYNTKLRLFKNMGEGDVAVLNLSEPSLPAEKLEGAIPKSVGLRTVTTDDGRHGMDRNSFTSPTTYRDGETVVLSGLKVALSELPLYGAHNVTNALMAWEMTAGLVEALSEEQKHAMIKALHGFRGLAHRMERLGERSGVLVINNSMCTNPRAVIVSSAGLPVRQHLLMGGLTKNLDFSPVKEYLAASGHQAYLFGSPEEGDQGLGRQLGDKWPCYPTLEEAFESAVKHARQGEAIVLSPGCLSAFPFSNFRERGDAFKQIAREWLEK